MELGIADWTRIMRAGLFLSGCIWVAHFVFRVKLFEALVLGGVVGFFVRGQLFKAGVL